MPHATDHAIRSLRYFIAALLADCVAENYFAGFSGGSIFVSSLTLATLR
jgi:hypothetical protein